MPFSDEELKYHNPQGWWRHDGSISIELAEEPTERIRAVTPPSATIEGTVVTVADGSVLQSNGGIQLYGRPDDGAPFFYGYVFIRCIRRGDGSLLWRNHDCC